MWTLFGLPSCAGLRQPSPWVLKVELAMKYLEIDHSSQQPQILRIPSSTPTGKVPCLVMEDGPLCESDRILRTIEERCPHRNYPHPADEDHALGTAFVRLVEDHLFFIICKTKHLDPVGSKEMWDQMLSKRPGFLKWLVRKGVQKMMKARLDSTSLGGLRDEEVYEEAYKDIEALSAQLSKGGFIASESLSIYDFSVAAHIASIFYWRIDNWLTPLFKENQIFQAYLERVAKSVGGFEFEVLAPIEN